MIVSCLVLSCCSVPVFAEFCCDYLRFDNARATEHFGEGAAFGWCGASYVASGAAFGICVLRCGYCPVFVCCSALRTDFWWVAFLTLVGGAGTSVFVGVCHCVWCLVVCESDRFIWLESIYGI